MYRAFRSDAVAGALEDGANIPILELVDHALDTDVSAGGEEEEARGNDEDIEDALEPATQ